MGEPLKKATIEEVWAAIKASEEASLKASEASLKASKASLKASKEASEASLKASKEASKEASEASAKFRRDFEETLRISEEARRKGEEALRESQRKTEESQRKTAESQRKTEESLQQTQKEVRELNKSLKEANGNFNNKWGHFLENLLEGDLVKLLDGRGIRMERTLPRVKVKEAGRILAEYDLLAVNGKENVVVEVKTTLEKDAVGRFIEKLKKFRNHLPEHKNKILYGAMAYMSLKENDGSKDFPEYADASEMAQEKGLFLIQSPGGAKDVSKIVNNKDFKPKVF